ncbi:MAG: hypothetical protein AAFV53_07090 [Myxococcota bacterium]
MHKLTMTALLGASLTSGCVIYDNDCDYSDSGYWGIEDGRDRPDSDHDDNDDDAPAIQFALNPSDIYPGEVIIASLTADMDIDYSSIVEVEFLSDDIVLCTSQAREDELLMTIGAADNAAYGAVDLVIIFDDGDTAYMNDAITILDPGSDNGGNDGGGNDGGGSDGGGSDGGGSDGGGSDGGGSDGGGSDGGGSDGGGSDGGICG